MDVPPIAPGDVLIGLASSGLHTNGYSLARHLLFENAGMYVETHIHELGCTVGDELLKVHREYLTALEPFLGNEQLHGLAHITGGGIFDNVQRVLPDGCRAVVEKASWDPLPIFKTLVRLGNLPDEEAYRVLNMGIGMVLAVDQDAADDLLRGLSEDPVGARVIGEIRSGDRTVELV